MEESSYCACLNKYDTTGLMIKMDALLKRTAGDHWDEKNPVVSFLNGAKESGGDFGEFSDPEVFAAFQNLCVICRD